MTTPQDRLAAALKGHRLDIHEGHGNGEGACGSCREALEHVLAADPTIAADMELGRKYRESAYATIMELGRKYRESAYATILEADAQSAADMELGRRIRDANDPFLRNTLMDSGIAIDDVDYAIRQFRRAALTEGEK